MMKKTCFTILLSIAFLGVFNSALAATTYYVATNGSDANTGTQASPWLTLQKAEDNMVAGDTTIVKDGTYSTTSPEAYSTHTAIVDCSKTGTANAPITFQAEHQGKAILDGDNNLLSNAFYIQNPACAYMTVRGFTIQNFLWAGINFEQGSPANFGFTITNNTFQYLGQTCTSTAFGLGIGVYTNDLTNVVVDQNVFHDNGRFDIGQNGCLVNNISHDHDLYIDGTFNMRVSNNIFWNRLNGWNIQVYGGIASTSGLMIVNNTFYGHNNDVTGQMIMDWTGCDGCRIQNNIFYQPGAAAIRFQQDGPTFYHDLQINNNIVYQGVLQSLSSGVQSSYPNGVITGVSTSSNQINVDPLLVNPTAYDFRLQLGSPAINAGLSTTSFINDMNNVYRAQGGGWDIGAYEFPFTEFQAVGNVLLSGNVSIQ